MAGLPALVIAGLKGRRAGGVAAIFVVLTLAALAISVGVTVVDAGTRELDDAAREADVAHVVAYGDGAALEQAARDPELTATAGPFGASEVLLELTGGDEETRIVAIDDPSLAVGRPLLRTGRWLDPRRDDEIVLDRSAAIDLGVEPGDELTFRSDDASATFRVAGTAIDLTDCAFPECDPVRAYVGTAGLARLGGPQFSQLLARVADASLSDTVAARMITTVPGVTTTDSWPDTRGDLLTVDRIFGRFITAFGLFVLVAACIVVAGTMVVRMTARRREIGLLEAIGCTSRQVGLALVAEHLVIGFAATVVGWVSAGFLAPQLQIGIADVLGRPSPSWSLWTLVFTGTTMAVILVLATALPAWRAGRLAVSDVVRGVPWQRLSWLARRNARLPGRLVTLGVKEAAARPVRSVLAALAVALAVITAIIAVGFISTISAAIENPQRVGDPWDAAVVPAPDASADQIEAALAATPEAAGWFTETGRRATIGNDAFLVQAIGGDPDAARFEIGDGRRLERAGEAVIGYGMIRRFGIDLGDEVAFNVGDSTFTTVIVGWYRETEDSGEILQFRFEQLQGTITDATPDVVRVVAAPGVERSTLATALAARLGSSARVEALDVDTGDLGAFETVLRLIALVVGMVAAANLLSVMLTSSRESARTIGVEQTLGLTPGQLVAQGGLAGASIGLVGIVVGIPLGLVLYRLMSDAVTKLIGIGPGFGRLPSVAPLTTVALGALVATALLGAAATRRMASVPAAELVRWE